jgi:hypothetical protein
MDKIKGDYRNPLCISIPLDSSLRRELINIFNLFLFCGGVDSGWEESEEAELNAWDDTWEDDDDSQDFAVHLK